MSIRANRSTTNLLPQEPESELLLLARGGGGADPEATSGDGMRQSTVLNMGLDWTKKGGNLSYTVGNSKIHFQRPLVTAVIVIATCLVFLALVASYRGVAAPTKNPVPAPHREPSEQRPLQIYPLTKPKDISKGVRQFKIALVADLDTDSKVKDKENTWRSVYKSGLFVWDSAKSNVTISWTAEEELTGTLAAGGRGMELSELITFDGKLLTCDDRTGILYRLSTDKKKRRKLAPWVILSDGDGDEAKPFKCEWATVKDDHLYVGGLGKEWTTSDGQLVNFNPMFVKKISAGGHVEHLDWHREYEKLRFAVGIEFPGYMIHEAVVWSPEHLEWFALPRRASKSKYDEVQDEKKGTNYLLRADPQFEAKVKVTKIGELVESHGFSSFKFVPGTGDSVIVALKTEELQGKVASYITAFNIDGTILYPETKISDHKLEGIEFV